MEGLHSFWQEHKVAESLAKSLGGVSDRYFRVPRNCVCSAEELEVIGAQASPLPGFYRVASSVSLSRLPMYAEGRAVGLDISSGAAVAGLDVQARHHVLDLCCAPGMKMLMLAEMACEGSVTGVDLSEHRLNVTRNVLRKYGAQRVRLFLAAGESFRVLAPPSEEERLKIAEASGIPIVSYRPVARKLLDDSGIAEDIVLEAPHKKAKKNRQFELPDLLWSSEFALGFESFALYDRVLVDAGELRRKREMEQVLNFSECTSDGAIRHRMVRDAEKAEDADEPVAQYRTKEEVEQISKLQSALLLRGWQLLKPGGILVYCTCSLLRAQNEDVVESLMKVRNDVILEQFPIVDSIQHVASELKGAVYVRGANSLFAARLRKK